MKNLYLRLLLTCVGIFCLSLASFADNSILPPKLTTHKEICIEPTLKVVPLYTDINLTNLNVGDTFLAGDFLIHVVEVANSYSPTGVFSGKGYVDVKILNNRIAKLAVKFNNITINECYEMTNGFCESEYDPNWSNIIALDGTTTNTENSEINTDAVKGTYTDIIDLLENYSGTPQEQAQLKTYIDALKSTPNDTTFTNVKTNIITDTQALACYTSTAGNRIDASACISKEAMITQLKKSLEALPKETVVFQTNLHRGLFQGEGGTDKFPTEFAQITQNQIDEKAGNQGKAVIASLRNLDLNATKRRYENSTLGFRKVVSTFNANTVLNNFYNGNGQTLTFSLNSNLSNQVPKTIGFQTFYRNYWLRIYTKLNNFNELTSPYVFDKDIGGIDLPNFNNESEIPFYDLYAIMGGTQHIIVDLKIIKVTSTDIYLGTQTSLRVESKFTIQDWFGADWDDINEIVKGNVGSLNGFFWLQHFYGMQPFKTEVFCKKTEYIAQ